MPLRLIEVVVPRESRDAAAEAIGDQPVVDSWRHDLEGDRVRLAFLLDAGAAEPLMDELQRRVGDTEGFRVVLLPVEAALPRPDGSDGTEPAEDAEAPAPAGRIGREELYADLSEGARFTPVFAVMTGLSAIVCAFGLLMDDLAVVIGGMVIAPLLSPLVAVSLATTLADGELALSGLTTGTGGLAIAFVLSAALGMAVPVDPEIPALATRSTITLGHVGLALAAGIAGTLAFTAGTAEAVIGVMVAVALVPPLVATGLLWGAGHTGPAGGALLLTLTNFICVNLAGVATFLVQGVRPGRWWEAERARRSSVRALLVWSVLLLGLVAVIVWGVG